MDRLSPTRRPAGSPGGYQTWRSLLFLHWEADARALGALLPPELTVDTFEGKAYVGLVAFRMRGVRPSRWLPALPTARDFDEVNVRTYVHLAGEEPGVWFLSLDAGSALAVLGARALFHLPYYHARFEVSSEPEGREHRYTSRRHWASDEPAGVDLAWEVGGDLGPATPGTFEHFLVERYSLYTRGARGGLLRGRVHHGPYPLRAATATTVVDTLVAATGLSPVSGPPVSTLYSRGVDVEIFGLHRARSPA